MSTRGANAERGRFVASTAFVALAGALFAGWVGFRPGGATASLYFDDLATLGAAIAATVFCLRAAGRDSKALRRFWRLFAAAAGSWALAEGIWAVYELVVRQDVPLPSWADVGYLAAIPLAVAALLSHPAISVGRARTIRSALDALVLATSLLLLSWMFVLGPLWRSSDMTTLGGVVDLAYPLGDVVIIFFVVVAMRGVGSGARLSLWCLLGGLLAIALADSVYAYLTEVKSYTSGGLVDVGWFAGYLGIAQGAYVAHAGPVPRPGVEAARPSTVSLVAPFLPVLGALALIAVQIQTAHHLDGASWAAAFVLVALVLIRQGLLALDLASAARTREPGYSWEGPWAP